MKSTGEKEYVCCGARTLSIPTLKQVAVVLDTADSTVMYIYMYPILLCICLHKLIVCVCVCVGVCVGVCVCVLEVMRV